MADHHARSLAYAARSGRLTAAVEFLLEVIEELPLTLDPFHQDKVDQARRILGDASFIPDSQ